MEELRGPRPLALDHRMRRARESLAIVAAVFRNPDLRRVQLAWGASITGEWLHFVALGVFAYEVGGARAVGLIGFVRMLPAAAIAPFAAVLGDRFRRERFLVTVALVGVVALGGSALAFVIGSDIVVFGLAQRRFLHGDLENSGLKIGRVVR